MSATDSSLRVAANFSCTGQGSGLAIFISYFLHWGSGCQSGGGVAPRAGRSARRLVLPSMGGGQHLAQGGNGVEVPLACAADLGDGTGVPGVDGAGLAAGLDQTIGRVLGGAECVLHLWVHVGGSWVESGRRKKGLSAQAASSLAISRSRRPARA